MSGNIGWTAQSSHGWIHDEGVPGNVFTEDQLPDPELQRIANINPEQYRRQHGLWVEPGTNDRPLFIGTESGSTPAQVRKGSKPHESFISYIPELDPIAE